MTIRTVQGKPALTPQIVGEARIYDVDLTDDGGLPGGTTTSQLTLTARDDATGADVSSDVVPSGSVLAVAGNVVSIRVRSSAPRTARVMLEFTNASATPGRQYWRFRFVEP